MCLVIKFVDFIMCFATFSEIVKEQLIVHNKQWASPREHTPPPSQPTAHLADIMEQIDVLEKSGINHKSTSL